MSALALPPIDGPALIRLHNLGAPHAAALARLVASLGGTERAHERDLFLQQAAGICRSVNPQRPHALARTLETRCLMLLRALPSFVDAGSLDGALTAALITNALVAPSFSTIRRAIATSSEMLCSEQNIKTQHI